MIAADVIQLANRYLLVVEAVAFAGTVLVAAIWYHDPGGNWEPLVAISGLVAVGVDIYRRFARSALKTRFESNAARIQHRESLRQALQEEIYRCRAEKLRQDVIIRHVDRVDSYPNLDPDEAGISPWFRASLVDTYERGIVLCLQIGGLKKAMTGYRYVDHVNGEKSDVTAWLLTDVPYDSIVSVNIDGDKYYSYPHIYCHFDFNGEPYERKWFAEKEDLPHGHPYFKQLASYDEVVRNNPTEGDLYFG